MPLPVIANIVRCSIEWGAAGVIQNPDRSVNVMHVEASSGSAQDIADALSEGWSTLDATLVTIPSSYVVQNITVLPLDGTTAGTPCVPAIQAEGLGSGEYISQGCLVMSWHTAARGPAGRGRTYLGPICENQQSSGQGAWDPASVAAEGQELIDFMQAASFPLVVASYVHAVAHTITSATNDGAVRTQRRRQQL